MLKTAQRGIDHKSDRRASTCRLVRQDGGLERRGATSPSASTPRVLVAPMIEARGVEMLLGMVHDAQFGPVVLVGAGGVHVEALADAVYAVPPFGPAEAAGSWIGCASRRS